MKKENKLQFRVFGKRALFSTPDSRMGGEKFSYQIPTYEALVGITSSIYWKPTIQWVIHRVRILNPIQTESVSVKLHRMKGGSDLSYYTYLRDVEYEVEASFVWNEERPDLENDRNENKHYFMAKRAIEKGGRRDVFLGTRECQAYVEPVEFEKRPGYYDEIPELGFDLSFHSFTYPDQNKSKNLIANFWYPIMKNGTVEFIQPKDCPTTRVLRKANKKTFEIGKNMKSIEEEVKDDELPI